MNTQRSDDSVTFTVKKTHLWVAMGLALILAFGGGLGVSWLYYRSETTSPQISTENASRQTQQASVVQIDIDGRPYLGPEDAQVTIAEFTDYECPFCARHFRDTMPQLLREYDGDIKYVILNFPISRIHPFAQKAAEAAECAYDQNKFWEYHDVLFQNQRALDAPSLKIHAEEVGLDTDAFSACLDSGAKAPLVLDDLQDGQRYGVSATPTFFINGQRLIGARPFRSFQTLIDAALSR